VKALYGIAITRKFATSDGIRSQGWSVLTFMATAIKNKINFLSGITGLFEESWFMMVSK
jgi:hypothetical protein